MLFRSHELANQGYVVRISAGRRTYVELAEPLMRICIEIKDNRTRQLRLFVEFLRHWYSSRESRSKRSRIKAGLLESVRLAGLHLAATANECDALHAIDSALSITPKALELIAVRAEILIALKDYSSANASLDQAELLGINDVQLDNLRIELFIKERGVTGLGLVEKHLKEKPEKDLKVLDWYSAVWELLHSALENDGPLGFSVCIREIRNDVSVELIEDCLAESIMKLCFQDPGVGIFSSPDWKSAFIVIRESLSSLESCRLILDFLSAASDYAIDRNGEALLRLPLEQRNLILSSFGSES